MGADSVPSFHTKAVKAAEDRVAGAHAAKTAAASVLASIDEVLADGLETVA